MEIYKEAFQMPAAAIPQVTQLIKTNSNLIIGALHEPVAALGE
jgi:hypothetical protein